MELLEAIDMHVHFGPDPHLQRSVTAYQAAVQARDAGHGGIVLKSHDFSTMGVASAINEILPGLDVFGGICCDTSIGGLNVQAVQDALGIGAAIVWMPTLSVKADWERYGRARGVPAPGLQICHQGSLVTQALEIIALVAQHGRLLATGHISIEEHLAVAAAMPPGGKLIVTHAMDRQCGPGDEMNVEVLKELVNRGAVVEFCAGTAIGAHATRTVAEIAAAIRTIGVGKCVLSTDFGQAFNPLPVEGLSNFADRLAEHGFSIAELRRMTADNPRALLS